MSNLLFSEIDQTHLYDGIDIDQATQEEIFEWFQFREVCDNEKFSIFFRRKLKNEAHRYNELIRLEYTEFDPLVSSYHESWTKTEGTHTGSSSESGQYSKTGSNQQSDTTTYNSGNTHTGTVVTDSDNTQSGSNSDTSDTGSLQRALPNGAGLSYGTFPDSLNWNTASGQEESKSTGSSSNSSSSSTDTTVTNNLADAHTGSDTVAGSGSNTDAGSDSKTGTTTGSDENETQYISTGRDGLTPQDALYRAMEYVRVSCAFDWLRDELESCFISVYDV